MVDTSKWHQSQRGFFSGALFELMKENHNIVVLTGDLGYGQFDKIRENLPAQFINCGASEQAMLGVAVGMALEGKVVFVYTITSFLMRAAETINLYLHHEQIPVHLVGGGRDDNYRHDGYSHFAYVAQDYIKSLDIKTYCPEEKEDVPAMLEQIVKDNKPTFLSVKR